MSLTSVRHSASRWHVTQQLLIGSLAVLLMTVLVPSRPVRATPLHHTAARAQTHATLQGTVARGQSAFALLRLAGVSTPEVLRLQRAIRSVYDLQYLRIGQPYWVDVTADGLLQRFVYEVDTQHRLEVERHGQTFHGRPIPIASEPQERVVRGIIRGSLYQALASQGEIPKLAADLADIFAWEIDFSKDVRDGDTFRLLIQVSSQDGTVVDYQRILAAELVTQGQVIGYVGATGLATGPHLCFRLTKNGTYLNPLRHQSLEAPSVARQALPAFHAYAERLLAKLEPSEATPQQVAAHVSALGAQDTEANGK